ncbi:hypothetical protein [Duganella violaceipulchra]|uniref:Uncharacterized protein n=1 Tax=Duganella violaceipulchra TaxID=2849652 RepID=A0AA41L804_9BURK|nr:hypothetical protein [Duganella violaceicalia]MBV6324882.1 hypothetical protein [Duganella violaceicalia]MCP2012370.1 hypothetical protein [Duganella violaceicalia]
MNKVVHIKAYFKPVGEVQTVKIPTGETKKGFFGGEKEVFEKQKQWIQTGYSDREIDGERLSQDIEAAVARLNREGYEVATIVPAISGQYYFKYEHKPGGVNHGGSGYGYGYGFSYTESVTIVGRRTSASSA